MCSLTSGTVWVMSTQETPDWRSPLLQLLSVWQSVSLWWPTGVFFFFFFFYNCLHTHHVWKKQYVFQPGAGLNLWPRQRFSWDPPSAGERLVEGLMVIWSTLLNELTQPLTDVQCEGSVVRSDPWICVWLWMRQQQSSARRRRSACINRKSLFEHKPRVFVPQQLPLWKT